ncbi:MAG: threonine synthase [Prevotellaceae bacterium]|jgi:threonine synthase|nr:threonine synthase [Prevotellaceae bacterium]
MQFKSTRSSEKTGAEEAICRGIAADGGLYVPCEFPKIDLQELAGKEYCDIAFHILSQFLTGFDDLRKHILTAYAGSIPVALHCLNANAGILELFHGNTAAFKDVALQLLPYLLTASMRKTGEKRKAVILVATSGDTGSSCMSGFANVPDTEVIVFYPDAGISEIQKRQMTAQEGENVHAIAVRGNFDDAQKAVKEIFADSDFLRNFADRYVFSSANSINPGRLLPQIAYYFYAYAALLDSGRIENGEQVNFSVPTGNFGNILAGYYAAKMGLPVKKLICAINRNCVLYDFFNTGIYDRNREFYVTLSPSMDILVSSNLERLIYDFYGEDTVIATQSSLKKSGKFAIDNSKMREIFRVEKINDDETTAIIGKVYAENKYLLDPHSAIAFGAYEKCVNDNVYTVILATASPYKFFETVEKATGEKLNENNMPCKLKNIMNKPVLHNKIIDRDKMREAIKEVLQR